MGKGSVDVQGLLGDGDAPLGRKRLEGTHVVKPVGELDENNADVFRHRDQHLPDAGRPCDPVLGTAVLGDELLCNHLGLGQLGNAVDELGNLWAESLFELGRRDVAVFYHVVEDGRRKGVRV